MKKNPGVQNVEVSLNKGLATIMLKEKNNVSIEQFRKAVGEKGFTPKEAYVVAIGTIYMANNVVYAKISGGNDVLKLKTDPHSKLPLLQEFLSNVVVLQGTIPERAKDSKEDALLVRSISLVAPPGKSSRL